MFGQFCKKFGSCSNAELSVDLPQVRFYCYLANEEALSNLTVRVPLRKLAKNLGFACGERLDSSQFPLFRLNPEAIGKSLVMRSAEEIRKLNAMRVNTMQGS